MDRQQIRDTLVIERYLQGKLSAEEEQAFEETYLADAEVLNDLVLTEQLREGLADTGGEHSGFAAPAAREPGWFGSPRYALAASIVAAFGLVSSGWLYVQNEDFRSGAQRTATNTRLLPLVTVRGANVNTLEVPPAGELTVLLLDPGYTEHDQFRARLIRTDGGAATEVLRADELTATYEGLVALSLPQGMLTAGAYEIELDARERDWPAGRDFEPLTRTPLTVVAP
jgi:hypothetical protein